MHRVKGSIESCIMPTKTTIHIYFSSDNDETFKTMPKVEVGPNNQLIVSCKLAQRGDVYLSTIPKLDAKQKSFKKEGDLHKLELSADDEHYVGKVVYVVVRQGVHGLIYPIKTDVEAKGLKKKLFVKSTELARFFFRCREKVHVQDVGR